MNERDNNDEVRIAFLGDFSLNDHLLNQVRSGSTEGFLSDVRALTKKADLVIANLESCWDLDGRAAPAGFEGKIHIKTTPEIVTALKFLNVKVVSTANNHSFDFGYDGWKALREIIENEEIAHIGGGANIKEASEPLILGMDGIRLGILTYAGREVGAIYADETSCGVNPFDIERTKVEVASLKASCDFVIVYIHWGEERILMPSPKQRAWAHEMARAGADVIIGHHAHVLQGYEMIGNTHVFYSLGNFLMADVYEGNKRRVRFIRPNYVTAVPFFSITRAKNPKLECLVGLYSDGTKIRLLPTMQFQRRWRKLCNALKHKDYASAFLRHQDFMWRYYIPLRYLSLQNLIDNPSALINSFKFSKIKRLLGQGQSPWQTDSFSPKDEDR